MASSARLLVHIKAELYMFCLHNPLPPLFILSINPFLIRFVDISAILRRRTTHMHIQQYITNCDMWNHQEDSLLIHER